MCLPPPCRRARRSSSTAASTKREWQNAIRCDDWRRTLPFLRDDPRYRNDVRILSTERGLAAAFILDQPPQERRMKPRTPRDAEAFTGDSVALVVDFDATAQCRLRVRGRRSAAACATAW